MTLLPVLRDALPTTAIWRFVVAITALCLAGLLAFSFATPARHPVKEANTYLDSGVVEFERSLIQRHGNPFPFVRNPVQGWALSFKDRRRFLEQLTANAHAKGVSYEPIAVHLFRLKTIAHSTNGFKYTRIYDDIQKLLLDDREYQKHGTHLPLLVDTPFGVTYRTHPNNLVVSDIEAFSMGGMTHIDKVLSAAGELGLPLDTEVISSSGARYVLADVLEDSLQRQSGLQELEWSLIAYSDYLLAQNSWTNSLGNNVTVDSLARSLLYRSGTGSCAGTHNLYALSKLLLRNRDSPGFLAPHTSAHIKETLKKISIRLSTTQREDGSWGTNWNGDTPSEQASVDDPLTVTGHMLEWMAIVPTEFRPSEQTIIRAAMFVESYLKSSKEVFSREIFAASHAIRALVHLSEGTVEPLDDPVQLEP